MIINNNPRFKKSNKHNEVFFTMQSRIVIMKLACLFFVCLFGFVAWFDGSSLWLNTRCCNTPQWGCPAVQASIPLIKAIDPGAGESGGPEKWMVGR